MAVMGFVVPQGSMDQLMKFSVQMMTQNPTLSHRYRSFYPVNLHQLRNLNGLPSWLPSAMSTTSAAASYRSLLR